MATAADTKPRKKAATKAAEATRQAAADAKAVGDQ